MAYQRPASAFRNAFGAADSEFPYQEGRYILYVSHACPWANGVLQCAVLKGLISPTTVQTGTPAASDVLQLCVVHPTWQQTQPRRDREQQEEFEKQNIKAEVNAGGVSAKAVHAGWVFAAPGTALLPIGVMKNGADFGLTLPGSVEEICEGEVTLSPKDLGDFGIKSSCCTEDKSRFKAKSLRDLYEICEATSQHDENFTGGQTSRKTAIVGPRVRPTTPMLFDTKTEKIVNNQSTDLLSAFNAWPVEYVEKPKELPAPLDLFPPSISQEVLDMIDRVYSINNGVYRCGFASTQLEYDQAAEMLQRGMEQMEAYVEDGFAKGFEFLLGSSLTAADIRLFNTLVRMDEVYVVYFKCAFASLLSGRYPSLLKYTARVWHSCGGLLKASIFMDEIQNHYFTSHMVRNMYAIRPRPVGFLEILDKMETADSRL